MSNKSIREMKNLSKDELSAKAREIEASLFQSRMQRTTGQLADTASIWRHRKALARVKTLQGQADRKSEGSNKKATTKA